MKCPKCGFQPIDSTEECPNCGIIFDKYLKLNKNSSTLVSLENQATEDKIDKKAFIKDLFLKLKKGAIKQLKKFSYLKEFCKNGDFCYN